MLWNIHYILLLISHYYGISLLNRFIFFCSAIRKENISILLNSPYTFIFHNLILNNEENCQVRQKIEKLEPGIMKSYLDLSLVCCQNTVFIFWGIYLKNNRHPKLKNSEATHTIYLCVHISFWKHLTIKN